MVSQQGDPIKNSILLKTNQENFGGAEGREAHCEAQAGIKIARRNINNLRYAAFTTLTAEREKELKSLWMKVQECQEAFNKRLPVCCFRSVRNPLVLVNS